MAQLHEVLAVEDSLKKVANKLTLESKKTLNKDNLFMGQTRSLKMFDQDLEHLNTTTHLKLETTVSENLDYTLKAIAKYWDAVAQKDKANQVATADVIVDSVLILKDVPATTLLGLETKLNELRPLLEAIPTLPPGIEWIENPDAEKANVYKTKVPIIQQKSEKEIEAKVLYAATKEHPAQVKEYTVNKVVGNYETVQQCGMVSSHTKAILISRLESMQNAVKQARQRANTAKVEPVKVAGNIFDYITAGII